MSAQRHFFFFSFNNSCIHHPPTYTYTYLINNSPRVNELWGWGIFYFFASKLNLGAVQCPTDCVCAFSYSVVSDTLWPCGLGPARFLCPRDYLCKNTGVGCHFLLQGILPIQGSNPHFLNYRQVLYPLRHWGILVWLRLILNTDFLGTVFYVGI